MDETNGKKQNIAAKGFEPKRRRFRVRKKKRINPARLISISFLPSVFTLLSLFFGFQALLNVIKANFPTAITMIMICVVLDGFDGTIARLTKTESNFGSQLDSLVDAVSFGLTPGALIYFWGFKNLDPNIGAIIGFIFLAAGVIRLARFNIYKEAHLYPSNIFIGLPIPLGAMAICAWILLFNATPPEKPLAVCGFAAYAVIIALLMVSKIRYHTVKNLSVRDNLPMLLIMALVVSFAILYPAHILPVLAGLYIFSPLYWLIFKRRPHADAARGPRPEETPPAPAKPRPGTER